MTDLPIIDRVRLDRVCMGNPAMAREFLDMLIEEATPLVAGLPELLAAGDAGAIRESAHAIKGIAGNVGAARLQATALALEHAAAEDGGPGALAGHLDHLTAALSELRTEREAVT